MEYKQGLGFYSTGLHKAAEGVSGDQAIMRRSLLLVDFTILDKVKDKSLAGRKRGQTKAKIAAGKRARTQHKAQQKAANNAWWQQRNSGGRAGDGEVAAGSEIYAESQV